jgi:hypothetical protein
VIYFKALFRQKNIKQINSETEKSKIHLNLEKEFFKLLSDRNWTFVCVQRKQFIITFSGTSVGRVLQEIEEETKKVCVNLDVVKWIRKKNFLFVCFLHAVGHSEGPSFICWS